MRLREMRHAVSSVLSPSRAASCHCAPTAGSRRRQDSQPSKRCFVSSRTSARTARRGFTLIELLVVIAIIATLAAVVAPSLFGNVGEARRSTAKSQIQILALALDAYRIDNDAYPSSEQGLQALR